MDAKKDYLVSYDFGKAGVWALLKARSVAEIKAKYPEFEVVKEAPSFLDRSAASTLTFDIDEEPKGLLAEIIHERKK